MELRRLGRTDIQVATAALGTMTFGSQTTEEDALRQLDMAVDAGLNFIDTAESYPVPPGERWAFRTEEIIGAWLRARGGRDRLVLATKVAGPEPGRTWLRGGRNRLDAPNIAAALEASLARLHTDRIDLYQLHWPDRKVNRMGRRGWRPAPDEDAVPLLETIRALGEHVRAGRIRHWGLSNETPWGLMSAVRLAEEHGLPRPVSIQNPYSLLNRSFEVGLAECAWREQVGLVAYAPLGAGTLTGKYLDGRVPEGSRRAFDGRNSRYRTPNADAATRRYVEAARRHGVDPVHMSIAFVRAQPFVTCALIGATTADQLAHALAGLDVTLPPDLLAEIETIQSELPDPCP